MQIQRKAEKSVLSRSQREGTKARDIYAKYPAEKAKALIDSLTKKGMWYYDPDFDKDEEDPTISSNGFLSYIDTTIKVSTS